MAYWVWNSGWIVTERKECAQRKTRLSTTWFIADAVYILLRANCGLDTEIPTNSCPFRSLGELVFSLRFKTAKEIYLRTRCKSELGSSVGIAIELRAGRSEIEARWGRDFPHLQIGPGAHPSCKMGTGSLPVVKCDRGVLLTTHPLLVPRSWNSSAIPLPILWATLSLQREKPYLYKICKSALTTVQEKECLFFNPSAWGHLNPSSYCDVGRLFYGVFKLWSKLQRKKMKK